MRREAVRTEGAGTDVDSDGKAKPPIGGTETDSEDDGKPVPTEPLPTRFFASIPIEPERAGLEVARIMDGLLVELTRTPGSTLRLMLEFEGAAVEQGYPKDVVETVKANARDLKLNEKCFGFEEK